MSHQVFWTRTEVSIIGTALYYTNQKEDGGQQVKTIQQVLKELGANEIEKAYFREHPVELKELEGCDDMTVGDLKKRVSDRFLRYLERMRSMETVQSEGQSVLFVFKGMKDGWLSEYFVGLIKKEEIEREADISKVETYGYEATEQREALTFLVADNKLTQDHLTEVAVDFLYEMSWFGYDQEGLADFLKTLDEPSELVKIDPEQMRKEAGIPIDETYQREKELENKLIKAERVYTDYCRNIELERLKSIM